MSIESEREALRLYAESLEIPTPEREAWLRGRASSEEVLGLLRGMLAVSSPGKTLSEKSGSESLLAALRLEGRVLDDFRLVREIGRGAVGRVFEAEQISLRRTVAVKVLSLEHCQNAEMLQRFRQEPEFQARLQHPNIVRVLATGTSDGWSYFAMDFVRGQSLMARLESEGPPTGSRPMDPASIQASVVLVEKIARALHHAHQNGVVHRDIKPFNILVDEAGEPFLSDFGLARVIDHGTLTGSLGDGLRGTLPYMSPEQVHDFHAADPRADIYSLGAVLYQLLTRALPFEADTSHELLAKILSPEAHVRPPHHFLRDFDPRLSSICTKALEKDPQDRFDTAEEFADSLQAFREGRPLDCRPISRLRQSGERRRSGRKLASQATLAAGVLATGLLLARRVSGREPGAEGLRVDLQLPAAVEVELARYAPDGSFLSPVAFGPRQGLCEFDLEEGAYRISLRSADGAFAELTRDLRSGEEPLVLVPRLATSTEVASGMVLVPGGSGELFDGELRATFTCEPFWIDVAPVTNAQFRTFLEATGQWPSPEWSAEWIALWNGTGPVARPAHWDQLPVVNVSWAMARAYAEWAGKRLPTAAEWMLAVGLEVESELTAEFWQGLAGSFQFARDNWLINEQGEPSSGLAYLSFVAPVDGTGTAFGPNGLQHAFGSVGQWLDTPYFTRDEQGQPVPSGLRYDVHSNWHFAPLAHEPYLSRRSGTDAATDLGFRCAKSAAP